MRINFYLPFVAAALLASIRVKAVRWGTSSSRHVLSRKFQATSIERRASDVVGTIRGGDADTDADAEADEERYSRQVYTLGPRAHKKVRGATVYVDGPRNSGLLVESVKNLALSGVGRIVIVTSSEDLDSKYQFEKFDDLGRTYSHGARMELGSDLTADASEEEILVEFLRRLNPSLKVEMMTRQHLSDETLNEDGVVLCVDRPYRTQLHMNDLARNRGLAFVAIETAGVYGRVFCDFGESFEIFDVDGETPLVVPLDHLEYGGGGENEYIVVNCISGENHDVSKGDEIEFKSSRGDHLPYRCEVTKVKNPECVLVKLLSDEISASEFVERVNSEASSFSRLKKTQTVNFVPLSQATEEALDKPELFTPSDLDKSWDDVRRSTIFGCFRILNEFVESTGTLPTINDFAYFMDRIQERHKEGESEGWKSHCDIFVRTCAAKLVPVQCLIGAVGAQECLKAVSGLYNPVRQFLLYDCDEVVPTTNLEGDGEDGMSAPSGQQYIMGAKVQKKLQKKRLFVVGAGAIGCEIMKNLAAMNAGTGKKGMVVITDMDTIEKSNLSRQLLFRDPDIGKYKSRAAQEAVSRLNPAMNVECHTSRVGDEEDGPFDARFWSKRLDIVLNALDNVEARLFMDGQCVSNEKALVDAGTLGSKGNVQVVVPHQTESYGSSVDPPEPAIAVCTLKNFPYAISHTIQWGRDLFDGLFIRRPKQATQYASLVKEIGIGGVEEKLIEELGEKTAAPLAKELAEDLLNWTPEKSQEDLKKECIEWAANLSRQLFHDAILDLLSQHPEDSLDEDGEPFWSGSRKMPKVLSFGIEADSTDRINKAIDENLTDFTRMAARLRIESFVGLVPWSAVSAEEAEIALRTVTDADADTNTESKESDVSGSKTGLESYHYGSMTPTEFEKDDDSNGHIRFITAASNLRALCYGIPPVDAMETRRVAGKIVPAMITTTAFVSALSCLELLKLVQNAPLKRHKNAFINLALPFFAFTSPLPAEPIEGLRGATHTIWDRIAFEEDGEVSEEGALTIRHLLERLAEKVSTEPDEIDISSVSLGELMIYVNFLHEDDEEHLDKTLWQAISEAVDSKREFDSAYSRESDGGDTGPGPDLQKAGYVDLTVTVDDLESGETVELPLVRVYKAHP